MGALTRGTLVSEGLLIAGDDSLVTRAGVWLNAELRKIYLSWSWPFLNKQSTTVTMAANVASFDFGAGSTETLEVSRILDPVNFYTADYGTKSVARIRQFRDHNESSDEILNKPSTNVGLPTLVRVIPSNTVYGKWTVKPSPIPDRLLSLIFNYLVLPANISSDSDIPIYPNDATLLQAVVAATCKFKSDSDAGWQARATSEAQTLTSMLKEDRATFGSVPGINARVRLASDVYKTRS